jgi:hypothetical protein
MVAIASTKAAADYLMIRFSGVEAVRISAPFSVRMTVFEMK